MMLDFSELLSGTIMLLAIYVIGFGSAAFVELSSEAADSNETSQVWSFNRLK